jgi:molecular chaperone DnaK
VPQIEVTFDIDADGVVDVSAKDLGTGKSQAIRVTAASGLDENEVERLVGEAEEHGQVDQQRRQMVELCNKADGLIYSTERTLEEFAENVADEDREELLEAVRSAREATQGEDAAALRAAVDELSALTYKLTETLYAELGGDGSE